MKINKIGYNHIHPGDFFIDRPDGSGDRLLLLIKSPAYIVIDGKRCHISANTVMLFSKDMPQLYGALGEEFINDWFHFDSNEQENDYLAALDIPSDKPFELGNLTVLSELIKNMYYETISANSHREETVGLYMRLFFIKLSEKIEQESGSGTGLYSDELSSLRAEIYNNPSKNWTVDQMASRLAISRSHFQHLYKQFFGVGAKTDVIYGRIEYAKYLLERTAYSVAEVSALCGYKNDVHFMRQFKKLTGVSPTVYRRR